MKSVLKNIVTIILLNVPLLSFTQNDKLIIGIETDSIYTNDFDDIILSPYPGSDSFYLDIDNNNEWDLHFTINESSGGTYGGAWINLYSNDSTMFSLDTLATQWIGNSNDLILDTTSEVKIFSIGDTLSITEHLSNSNYFTNV